MVPRVIAGLSDSELHAECPQVGARRTDADAAVADSPATAISNYHLGQVDYLRRFVTGNARNRARVALADPRSGRGGSDNMAPTMPPRLRAADPRAVVPRRLAAPSWRRGIRLAVLLFAGVTAGGTLGYMGDRGLERVGRVLHDHDQPSHDRRLPRGAPELSRAGQDVDHARALMPAWEPCSTPPSTDPGARRRGRDFHAHLPPAMVQAHASRHRESLHHLRLWPNRQRHCRGVSQPGACLMS